MKYLVLSIVIIAGSLTGSVLVMHSSLLPQSKIQVKKELLQGSSPMLQAHSMTLQGSSSHLQGSSPVLQNTFNPQQWQNISHFTD